MAEFYGTLKGVSGKVIHRTGTKSSGIKTSVQSWQGSIITSMSRDGYGRLMVYIECADDSASMGKPVFYGTFDEYISALQKGMGKAV